MKRAEGFGEFLYGSHRRINNIIRFNTRIKTFEESVAAHSFFVTFYSYIVSLFLIKQGHKVDIDIVLKKALMHDLEECISGDILTPFKKKFEKEYHDLTELSMQELLEPLPGDVKLWIHKFWRDSKVGIEGRIVDFCDDLSGLIYCREQLRSGNSYFKDIYEDYKSRLIKAAQTNETFGPFVAEILQKEGKYEKGNSRRAEKSML